MSFKKSVVLLTMLAIAGGTPAQAFRLIQNTSPGRQTSGALVTCNNPGGFLHWNTRNMNWYHNTAGQGAGKDAALKAAMHSWIWVLYTSYAPNYTGTTGAGWATDGVNTLLWSKGNGCTGSCLALTALVVGSGQTIVESDITFNADYAWNTNGSNWDTEAVAAHELGHSLGIHHSEVSTATMTAYYAGTAGRSLEADDVAALVCIENRYPLPPGFPISIRAANGQWWVAENGGGNVINANRNVIGPWERFRIIDLGAGRVALQCVNGQYVVAEGGGGQQLRCNRGAIDVWETFRLIPLGGSNYLFVCTNGQLVVADGGGGAGVSCGTGNGSREIFTVVP